MVQTSLLIIPSPCHPLPPCLFKRLISSPQGSSFHGAQLLTVGIRTMAGGRGPIGSDKTPVEYILHSCPILRELFLSRVSWLGHETELLPTELSYPNVELLGILYPTYSLVETRMGWHTGPIPANILGGRMMLRDKVDVAPRAIIEDALGNVLMPKCEIS